MAADGGAADGGDALTPLDQGSLLASLSEHHLFHVLLSLPLDAIAALAATSRALSATATALLPVVLSERSLPMHTPLRTLAHAERALLWESWHEGWQQRWPVGPSDPPLHEPACEIEVRRSATAPAEADAEASEGTSAGCLGLPSSALPAGRTLHQGLRARLSGLAHTPGSLSVEEHEGAEVMLVGRIETVWLVAVLRRRPRIRAARAEPLTWRQRYFADFSDVFIPEAVLQNSQLFWDLFKSLGFLQPARGLDRLGDIPVWDGGPIVALCNARNLTPLRAEGAGGRWAAGAWVSDPLRYLKLRGGWRMNHGGVHRDLGRPLRPSRISFALRIAGGCDSRSFFNFFLSSTSLPYRNRSSRLTQPLDSHIL